jgi:uncharacterized protein involved in cysteine biosynthesis
MKSGGSLSIWFFIGLSLLVNGILITGAGVWELVSHADNPVLSLNHHANIWWGALLLVLGAVYCHRFSPRRKRARNGGNP